MLYSLTLFFSMSINLTKSLTQGSTVRKFWNRVGFFHILSTPWFHVHIKDTFPSAHSSHFIIHISINTYSNNISAIQAPSHLSGFRKWIRGLNLFSPMLSRDVEGWACHASRTGLQDKSWISSQGWAFLQDNGSS